MVSASQQKSYGKENLHSLTEISNRKLKQIQQEMCFTWCFELVFAKKPGVNLCTAEYCLIEFFSSIFFVNLFIMLQSADQFLGKCDAKVLSTVA